MKKINELEMTVINGGDLRSKANAACAIIGVWSSVNGIGMSIPNGLCAGWTLGQYLW